MLIEHQGRRPEIDPTAYVAPTAVICGDVTIGPRTHVSYGAVIESHGSPVRIGTRTEVRIDGIVHVGSVLPPHSLVPIKWVAVGDPAQLFPPDEHQEIDAVLARMDFAQHVYGMERQPVDGVDMDMKELTRRETTGLADHRDDRELRD